MRVDGNSRLPKICCHSSGRFVLPVGWVGVATATEGSSGAFTCAGEGMGSGGAVAIEATVAVAVGVGAGAAACGDWGVLGAVVVEDEIGSAKSPSNSTSSHRRGCTL